MKTASFKVGNNRLLRLAAFLRTVPRKQFDYGTWGDAPPGQKVRAEIGCGTKACALGWATAIPTFKKLGLKMVENLDDSSIVYVELHNDGHVLEDFYAASKLFGISVSEAMHLFSPDKSSMYSVMSEVNATPKQVARKIETFVKERRKPAKIRK